MITYLIQASVCLLLFYLLYYGFLKRDKFFNMQRIYLLAMIGFSFTIPLIELGHYEPVVEQIPVVKGAMQYIALPSQPVTTNNTMNWLDYLLIAYFVIAALLLLRFIFTISKLYRVISGGEKVQVDRYVLLYTDKPVFIASFFKFIFIQKSLKLEEESLNYMLIHEKKHIRDFHFLDLIILELTKIVFWFNPITYLYSLSLKSVHEFVCDQEVIRHTTPDHYEKLLIKSFFNQMGIPLVSQFSDTPIKSRLSMIRKQNSVWFKRLKFLIVIPMIILLVYACNQEELPEVSKDRTLTGKVMDESGKPLPGVNIILKGMNKGTISNIEGNYKLDYKSTDSKELVFSFIALNSQTIAIGSKSVIDVVLEEDSNYEEEEELLNDYSDYTYDDGKVLKGKLTFADGTPLPGVKVILIGGNGGTITDVDGNYTLPVPDEDGMVMFSFLGLKTIAVPIKQRSIIDVQMEEEEVEIQDQ